MRTHIQDLFRRYRHLTSPALTKVQLEKGHRVRISNLLTHPCSCCHHQWLDVFNKAKQGDERLNAVLERFGRLVDARRENIRMRRIVNDSLVRPSPHHFQLPQHTHFPPHTHRPGNTASSIAPSSLAAYSNQAYTTDRSLDSTHNHPTSPACSTSGA